MGRHPRRRRERTALQLRESCPGVIARCGDELAAVEGEKTLAVTHGQVGDFPLLRAGYFRSDDDTDNADNTDAAVRVLAVTEKDGAIWDDGSTVACPVPEFPERTEGLSIPVPGGRLYGTGVITTGTTQATWPAGVIESTGEKTWRATGDYGAPRPEKVDPATGQDTGPVAWTAIPTTGLEKAASPRSWSQGVTPGHTWCFPVPDDAPGTGILPVHDGVVCVARTSAPESKIVTGDGRGHIGQTWPAPSAGLGGERWFPLHLNGRTVLLGSYRHLRWPGTDAHTATEPTPSLDARGNATWQILLPYPAWANLHVRSTDASTVLRTVTADAVTPLLAALADDPGMPLPTLDHLRLDNRKVTGVHHGHRPVDARCRPGSPAMTAAAALTGTGDPALCAGVVQTAALVVHETAALNTLVHTLREASSTTSDAGRGAGDTTASTPGVCVTESGVPCHGKTEKMTRTPHAPQPPEPVKTPVTPHSQAPDSTEVTDARRQMTELTDLMDGTPGYRGGTWRWPFTVGSEKATVTWARGPFVTDAERSAVSHVLRRTAETIDTHRWRRTAVDWSRKTVQATKTRSGGEAWDNPDDKDNSTHLIILGKADVTGDGNIAVNHILADLPDIDDLPTTLLGSPLCGAPELCRDLGIDPALTGDDLVAAADRLDTITAGTQDTPPPDTHLVTLLTTRLPLTPAAATLLLAGAYHPHHTVIPLDHNNNETPESRKARHAAARTLGIPATDVHPAFTLLQYLDPELLLTLLAASYDGITAVEKALGTVEPQAITLTDHVARTLVPTGFLYRHNPTVTTLRQVTRPLTPTDGPSPETTTDPAPRTLLSATLSLARDLTTTTPAAPTQAHHLANHLEALTTAADPRSDNTWHQDIDLPFTGPVEDSPHTHNILNHTAAPHIMDTGAASALHNGLFAPWGTELRDIATHGIPRAGNRNDPRVSTPETVDAMTTDLTVSPDAATYLLQLLTLTDPTDRNIREWNHWTKNQLDTTRTELLTTLPDHLIEAKRAHAGRTLFLTGTWWPGRQNTPGIEEWKTEFHPVRLWAGKAWTYIPGTPSFLPPATLFRAGWRRWRAGDRPGQ